MRFITIVCLMICRVSISSGQEITKHFDGSRMVYQIGNNEFKKFDDLEFAFEKFEKTRIGFTKYHRSKKTARILGITGLSSLAVGTAIFAIYSTGDCCVDAQKPGIIIFLSAIPQLVTSLGFHISFTIQKGNLIKTHNSELYKTGQLKNLDFNIGLNPNGIGVLISF